MIVFLKDVNARIRTAAVLALAQISPKAKTSDLAAMLQDNNADVRMAAAWAGGRMGPKGREAIPGLAARLSDEFEEPEVRVYAAWALLKTGADQIGVSYDVLITHRSRPFSIDSPPPTPTGLGRPMARLPKIAIPAAMTMLQRASITQSELQRRCRSRRLRREEARRRRRACGWVARKTAVLVQCVNGS